MPDGIEIDNGQRTSARTTALAVTGGVIVVLAWLEFALIRQQLAVGLWVIAVTARSIRLVSLGAERRAAVGTSLGVLAVVAQVAWLVTGVHALWVLCLTMAIALGFFLLASAWAGHRVGPSSRAGTRRAAAVVSAGVAAVSAVVVSALVITTAASPVPLIRSLHALGQSNSFEPDAQTPTAVINGAGRTSDVEYGSALPNSFLDIYIADNDASISRPTYITVHGAAG